MIRKKIQHQSKKMEFTVEGFKQMITAITAKVYQGRVDSYRKETI